MVKGQSIRIYLADGSVTGVRHAEVVNWTGQAIACPRARVGELSSWEEARRPGVYLLFGFNDEAGKPLAYIGEAENVYERLQSHLVGKDYWNEVVLFTNKDENLTKAHVRYLESKLVGIATGAKRYVITNGNQPQIALLPRGDRDAMESFLDQIRILLGVLGHRILEPVGGKEATEPHVTDTPGNGVPAAITVGVDLYLRVKNLEARARQTDEGVVVLTGSTAAPQARPALSSGYRKLRDRLIKTGVLQPDGDRLRFAEDYLFSNPSPAAAIVVGYPMNGREAWKDSKGRSLAQLEAAAAKS